jgi:two-component system cell cycle sensor histidine kinase/response regulator CckA
LPAASASVHRANLWAWAGGPTLTVALAVLIELLRGTSFAVTNPPSLLVIGIVLTAFAGGVTAGVISAAIAWLYTAFFFSAPDQLFQFSMENVRRVVMWGVSMPVTATLVGLLNRRAARALADAELATLREVQLEERARIADALRESEARFRLMVEAAPLCIHEIDRAGRVISMNPVGLKMMEAGDRQVIGTAYLDAVSTADRPRIGGLMALALAGHASEFEFTADSGTAPRVVSSCFVPMRARDGTVQKLLGITQDITERRHAEEALRDSRERLRLALEAAELGPWDWDVVTNQVVFSPEWKRQLGYEDHEIAGHFHEWEGRLHPQDRDHVLQMVRDYLDGRRPDYALEFRLRHKDGSYRWIYTRGVALRDREGRPTRMLGCHIDVTDRKRAVQALIESHGLLRAVIEGTSDAVLIKNLEGRLLLINPAAAALHGRAAADMLGSDAYSLFPADTSREIREHDLEVTTTGEPQVFEEHLSLANGPRTFLSSRAPYRDGDGKVIGTVTIGRDITELKRLEAQLLQAQKMEAVGQLAGGVAHDFNNLLTVIMGNAALVFDSLAADDPTRRSIAEIQQASERAATLTRQLLAFSRKQVLQPRVANLNSLLAQLVTLLQRLIGEDIEISLKASGDLGLVEVDPAVFEQAIINLSLNARDAMPDGGRLLIETKNAKVEQDLARDTELAPGPYVVVSVTDTGHGMDEETRARIFEPFFTTKPSGKGTGLGLAMVYGFVRQSGGHIEVESVEERGTTFTIYLPRTADTEVDQPRAARDGTLPSGTETVLLVEDESAVRALSRLILQTCGYSVLEARDGREAVSLASTHRGPIDILVTDLVMPHTSGRQLADVLGAARPGLRVLFMSGYTHEIIGRHGVLEADVAFLQKPFSPLTLALKVRQVLDEREHAS